MQYTSVLSTLFLFSSAVTAIAGSGTEIVARPAIFLGAECPSSPGSTKSINVTDINATSRSLTERTPVGCNANDKWQGYMYSNTGCSGVSFSRCTNSAVGCTAVWEALDQNEMKTIYVDAKSKCQINVYDDEDCEGSSWFIAAGKGPGCFSFASGGTYAAYAIGGCI